MWLLGAAALLIVVPSMFWVQHRYGLSKGVTKLVGIGVFAVLAVPWLIVLEFEDEPLTIKEHRRHNDYSFTNAEVAQRFAEMNDNG